MSRSRQLLLFIGLPILLLFVVLPLLLTGINIAQNGPGQADGRSPAEILGGPLQDTQVADILALPKSEIMQLFYALEAPAPGELNGEYRAVIVPVGVLAFGTSVYTHGVFGDGPWAGKVFRGAENGGGYNLFGAHIIQPELPAWPDDLIGQREFDTYYKESAFDAKQSFHLDYGAHNSGTVQSMRDELRRVRPGLYLGLGHMALGGGAINPAPFVLFGPARPVGTAPLSNQQ